MIKLDGLENQLLVLKDLRDSQRAIEACMACYQIEELCNCNGDTTLWPITEVIRKLQHHINRLTSDHAF